jgi:hypothetical protein
MTAIESFAQNYKFMSTDFAMKYKDDYGNWSDWTEWEESHCLVNINLDREEINIYSSEPQEFSIYDSTETEMDDDGGEQMKFMCIDADGLRCVVRLRVQDDGQMQLYVDYNDLMYVYCIEEK